MKLRMLTLQLLALMLLCSSATTKPMSYWKKTQETVKKYLPNTASQVGAALVLGGAGWVLYKKYYAAQEPNIFESANLEESNEQEEALRLVDEFQRKELEDKQLTPTLPTVKPGQALVESIGHPGNIVGVRDIIVEEHVAPLLPPAAPVVEPAQEQPAAPTLAEQIVQGVDWAPNAPVLANPAEPALESAQITQSVPMAPVSQEPTGSTQLSTSWHIGHGNPLAYREQVAQNIINGNILNSYIECSDKYLDSIIDLIWFFRGKALDKHQAFTEGTFVIKDKDFRIYNFLLNYVKMVNSDVTGDAKKDKPSIYSYFTPSSYSRPCSHYKHIKTYPRYGIDIRHSKEWQQKELPALKAHLLFGIIDEAEQLIFIKPENHGIYFWDGLLQHTVELFFSVSKKAGLITNDDDAGWNQKERVPQIFKIHMKPIVDQLTALQLFNVSLNKIVEEQGIKSMFNIRQRVLNTKDLLNPKDPRIPATASTVLENALAALDTLINAYRTKHDHLELRTGREVILTPEELTN